MDRTKEMILLDGLLDEYKFIEPVPGDMKMFVQSSTKQQLKKILKRAGKYSFFVGIYLYIFHLLKKLGISFLTFKIILTGFILALITAGFVIFNFFNQEKTASIVKVEGIIHDFKKIEHVGPIIKYEIGFRPFATNASDSIDKNTLHMLFQGIVQEIKKTKGAGFLKVIDGTEVKNSRYVIIGDISAFGPEIMVNARVMNSNSSRLMSSIVESGSKDDIDRISKAVAHKIIKEYERLR